MERKIVEKSRRTRMKNLYSTLQKFIPSNPRVTSVNDLLENAKVYIEGLKQRVEVMKTRKEELQMPIEGINQTIIEARDGGTTLKVVMIRCSDNNIVARPSIKLSDIVSILKEEGAEVLSANFYKVGSITYHTIHSQAYCSRIGVETGRIYERLQQLK